MPLDSIEEAVGSFPAALALGQLRNHRPLIKFGRNLAVGTAEEYIWTAGGKLDFLDAAETINVSSTSLNDADAGSGAWTLQINGLDNDFNAIDEIITLDGTTPVPTVNQYRRVHRAFVVTGDSLVGAAGTINGVAAVSASTQFQIIPEHNQTLQAIYTTPAGWAACIVGINASVAKLDEAAVRSYFRQNAVPDSVQRCARTFDLYQQYGGTNFPIAYVMPEKTDLWMAAKAVTTPVSVSGAWYMYLVPMGYAETLLAGISS